jgi:hypothetical protein
MNRTLTEATSPRAYHRARALIIARSLGTRAAAAYLRNLGYRLEYALAILATTGHINHDA